MKRLPLMLAALIGVAVSAPAQRARAPQIRERSAVHVRPVSSSAARASQATARYRTARSVTSSRSALRSSRRVVADRLEARLRGRPSGFSGCGRWVTQSQRVLVPGYWDRRYVPAAQGWVLDACGLRILSALTPATYQDVWVPARYEIQRRRVWVRY